MIPDKLPSGHRQTKMIVATRTKHIMMPVTVVTDDKYHMIYTPMQLKDEIKAMKGAKWMGYDPIEPIKAWRVDNCRRNNFNLEYLEGRNPFTIYKSPLQPLNLVPDRKTWTGELIHVYTHQNEMTAHMIQRRRCIISGEMGVGKTLAAIRAMELSLIRTIWYVAPRSALASVRLDSLKWCNLAKVTYMTYEEMKKTLQTWTPGVPPPQFVVFDESSRLKTPSSQRSQAAFHLAENMRNHWGDDAYIVLMSGSPAPKSPLDWYWQCEIACPGYIKEGDIHKFERRLAVMETVRDITTTAFNRRLAWKDGNPKICNTCGKAIDDKNHEDGMSKGYHQFTPITNEVENLYRRMAGLVYVKFKKDCLDLPDKIYKVIKLKPSLDLLRAARLVTGQARNAIQSLTLLRELSDGFQYRKTITDVQVCESCHGNKVLFNPNGQPEPCVACGGTGSTDKEEREVIEVPSPKIEYVTELLEEMEDVGRVVFYAGFAGSIERLCNHVRKHDWHYIRVDGRGWANSIDPSWDSLKCLQEFQGKNHDKIAFIGHPGSAGMGITLTASPVICYYSNDFNAESRIQSEDRIHRLGMDTNRGATIIDLILLPTDQKVLDNLKRKRELQSISLGELRDAIDKYEYTTTGT